MYGFAREKSVNTIRSVMLKKMVGDDDKLSTKSKVDLSRLPPCKDSLIPHIQRVNHRIALYKRANQATFPHPKPHDDGQGWEKKHGILEPVWSCGPIMPQTLVDLIEPVTNELEKDAEDEDEEDEDVDYEYEDILDEN